MDLNLVGLEEVETRDEMEVDGSEEVIYLYPDDLSYYTITLTQETPENEAILHVRYSKAIQYTLPCKNRKTKELKM